MTISYNKALESREMDTRFWGPSGWKLFHLIAFEYDDSTQSPAPVASFLETLPYILPCKFCRSSLTDYYRQHPVDTHLQDRTMKKWMFIIHNCVNAKLRSQGLHPAPNPTFSSVKHVYEDIRKKSWDNQLSLLWNFLFAVAYDHPKESSRHTKPMPDCPSDVLHCNDDKEKNKWNVLSWKRRTEWFRRFWSLLPVVLPEEIGRRWKIQEKKTPPTLECRRSTLAWLWRMRCGLDSGFRDPYTSTCQAISRYSSDCGTSRGSITCRKKYKSRRTKTMKKTKTK